MSIGIEGGVVVFAQSTSLLDYLQIIDRETYFFGSNIVNG